MACPPLLVRNLRNVTIENGSWARCENTQLQLGDLRQYTNNGIAYMSDVRDYLKERIDLEREFADKLDKLSKKYQRALRKTGVSYYGAGTPFKADAGGGSDAASVTTSGSTEGCVVRVVDS